MPHEEAQAWQTITCSSAAEAKAKIRVIRPQWEHNKYGFPYNRILDVNQNIPRSSAARNVFSGHRDIVLQ